MKTVSSVLTLWNKLLESNKIMFVIDGKREGILLHGSDIVFIVPAIVSAIEKAKEFFENYFLPVEARRLQAKTALAKVLSPVFIALITAYIVARTLNIAPNIQPIIAAAAVLTGVAIALLDKVTYYIVCKSALSEHLQAIKENVKYCEVCDAIAELFEKVMKSISENKVADIVSTTWSLYKLSIIKTRRGIIAVLEKAEGGE